MGVNGVRSNIESNQVGNEYFMIKKDVYEDMISYCQDALPYEGCGLLSGIKATGDTLWKLENESLNLNRFYMSVEAIKLAVQNMANKGEKLSGIFHSHPSSPAIPSSHDIENNLYTYLTYLIVSFYKGKVEVGCFKMDDKTASPLKLIILDD